VQEQHPVGRHKVVTHVTYARGNTHAPPCGYTIVISPRNDTFRVSIQNNAVAGNTGAI
jgi:hypothetical protein